MKNPLMLAKKEIQNEHRGLTTRSTGNGPAGRPIPVNSNVRPQKTHMPRSFLSWQDFWNFSRSVKHSSRYIHEKSVSAFLATLHQTGQDRIRTVKAGARVWRAQIGNEVDEREQDGVTWDEDIPFRAQRMKPLPFSAQEGRVNPKGMPCLYVASDKETAMAEVRPWIGINLSVAALTIRRELKLVDFSVGHDSYHPFFLEEPKSSERTQAVWSMVDRAFSAPVTADVSSAEYVPTQVIAEFFRQKGLDGVVYKSSLGAGYNLALFDLNCADVIYCALHSVKSVKFEFSEAGTGYHVRPKPVAEA